MSHLVGDLVQFFKFDEFTIDNWYFKCFYKGGTALFFLGSMVGVFSQYFGDPIECDFTTIDSEVAADYCWIHGSSYIPVEYQPHMKCIADLEGVASEDEAPDTSYYQWVVFMMLFQAGLFYIPYKTWLMLEGGLVETFGKDAKSAVIIIGDQKDGLEETETGIVMDVTVSKFVKFFKSVLHHNQWYFTKFVLCECMNVFLLYANFVMTDIFLQGRFWYYGIDVIKYYQLSRAERKLVVSPFCATFPTEVSCTVPNIGAAGGEQHHNGLCVLSQNIINEKIYLVIWCYLSLLTVMSVFFIIYRLSTILFEPLRFMILYSKVRHRYDDEVKKSLQYVLSKCYLGDWFLLVQLSDNYNMYFFREFIKELRAELRERPKKTKRSNAEDTLKKKKKLDVNESLLPDKADKQP